MSCKSLKGKGATSGLRVIYVYEFVHNKVTFMEIYYEQSRENETKERLKYFITTLI
jgi:hypothetical protein